MADKRMQKGLAALIEAETALEIGEGERARTKVAIIERSLENEVLNLNVLAQAALLEEDLKTAHDTFLQMRNYPLGRLKSLYGLAAISIKQGNFAKAYEELQELSLAYPKAPYILKAQFEIGVRLKKYDDLLSLLKPMVRYTKLTEPQANHHQAVLLYEQTQDPLSTLDLDAKKALLEKAHQLALDLVPVTLMLAQIYKIHDQVRKASKVIEKTWALSPHPLLALAYEGLEPAADALEHWQRIQLLASLTPHHIESELMIARVALDLKMWGQARATLNRLGKNNSHTMASCRLMAELELAEKGDETSSRRWLEMAFSAQPDARWVCNQCHISQETWDLTCHGCHAFDSLRWI
ncbi:MAG: hypothetical protein IBJ00_02855 [Alphaproteobacteria bacterium]|nr:hypothetical protein [Alphaproteobacteria bacterium]